MIIGAAMLCYALVIFPVTAASGPDEATQTTDTAPAESWFETEYAVGMIDLTLGDSSASGNLEPLDGSEDYPRELYVDGRVAFYLKGKIKGKYLLTAQMDTGEEPLEEILDKLGKRDPKRTFEKIDPEKYYPIYGDDSSLVNDAPSQGKLYARLEWDRSRVLWGDYQADLNDTTLMRYNRGLYGFQADLNRRDETTGAKLFWAQPLTAHSQDEFKSTQGMLYYLRNSDLVIGSEQLFAQTRDSSGGVIRETILENGRDYEIDYLQGRIILKRNLEASAGSGLITTTAPQGLNTYNVYLIASYDYEVDDPSYQSNFGLRLSQTLFDRLRIGGTAIQEALDTGSDYQLYGGDYRFDLTEYITLSGEWAQSEESPLHRFYSEDGGLTFTEFTPTTGLEPSGAWKAGLDVAFANFQLKGYYVFQEEGFSTQGRQALHDTVETNLDLSAKFGTIYGIRMQHSQVDEMTEKSVTKTIFQLSEDFQRLRLTEEVRVQDLDYLAEQYQDTVGALRLDYQLNDAVGLYAVAQRTLDRTEETPENDRNTVGADLKFNSNFSLNLERSNGDLGNTSALGARYQLNNDQQFYGKVQSGSDPYNGQLFQSLVGSKTKVSEKTNFYAENKVSNSDYETSNSTIYGVDYAPWKGWLLSADYTTGIAAKIGDHPTPYLLYWETDNSTLIPELSAPGSRIDRKIAGAGVAFRDGRMEYKTRLQARYDEGEEEIRQYVMTNRIKRKFGNAWTGFAKLNYSETNNITQDLDAARYVEGSLGWTYRPVTNDRWNLIGQYTYLEDLSPESQTDGTRPSERSQTLALDVIYDLNERWQVGEKLAHKRTSVKQVDPDADWISGDLYLWVNKVNYHVIKNWDLYGEYRTLWSTLADDCKSGALIAAYYLFDKGMRLGAGYNFTDYNDDLTHLGYRAGGWFINFTKAW